MESPKRDLEVLMFGAEFTDGVRQAVKEAVAKADAAGLVPAYRPAISKFDECRGTHKESREELLELRRQARAEKEERDRKNLVFHRKVFELLDEGGQPAEFIMHKANEMIQLWEHTGLNTTYGPMWKQLLDGEPTAARTFILSDNCGGWALALRSCSPFAHLAAYADDDWVQGKNLLRA